MFLEFDEALDNLIDKYVGVTGIDDLISALELKLMSLREQEQQVEQELGDDD